MGDGDEILHRQTRVEGHRQPDVVPASLARREHRRSDPVSIWHLVGGDTHWPAGRNVHGQVAAQVRDTGVARSLEPMSSADRKVIHDVLNEIDGVTTRSVGEEVGDTDTVDLLTARITAFEKELGQHRGFAGVDLGI